MDTVGFFADITSQLNVLKQDCEK